MRPGLRADALPCPCGTGIADELVLQLLPARGHYANTGRLCGSEIVLLAAISCQVEQLPGITVLPGGNQFVVVQAQGAVA